jgi:hypothetical protein
MRTRHQLLTGLAALSVLAFTAGCGSGSAAPPPPSAPPSSQEMPPGESPPAPTELSLLDWTRTHILSQTSDSARPVAVPGEEVADAETAQPFRDEGFFR